MLSKLWLIIKIIITQERYSPERIKHYSCGFTSFSFRVCRSIFLVPSGIIIAKVHNARIMAFHFRILQPQLALNSDPLSASDYQPISSLLS